MTQQQHDHQQHDSRHGHGHGHGDADAAAMAEILDLDAEVLHAYLSELMAWIGEHTADAPPVRILDLGSGTGTGTFALLGRFPDASVVAMDASEQFLHRLQDRAAATGLGERVRTVTADLDAGWPGSGDLDLVWASASLHHLADPDRVLSEILAALRPGGTLVVAEMSSFPRFLPDDVGFGRPGLEARCQAVVDGARAVDVPLMGSDWGPRLAAAGFTVEADRVFAIDLTSPLPEATRRYVELTLRRIRTRLDGALDAEDLAALDLLLDSDGPDGVRRRDDLSVRTERRVWLARRPG